MKFTSTFLLTALGAFVMGLYLPWWSIAIAAFAVAALIPQRPLLAFFSAFAGLFLLWGGLSFWIDQKNQGLLSHKVASLLPLQGSSILLIGVTALLGALVAGLAALSGSYLRMPPRETAA